MIEILSGADYHRFTRSIERMLPDIRTGVKDGWNKIGDDLKAQLVKDTQTHKHGRVYRIKGRLHRASAAGETPAKITGRYGRSADYIARVSELEFGVRVPYGGYLEDGTKNMAARRGVQNTIEKNHRGMAATMEDAIRRILT